MSDVLPSKHKLLRDALLVPCKSKEALRKWIKQYLRLDMPDSIVDPQSTSSPMDMIWEVYNIAMRGGRPDFQEAMSFASRDSFKTLGAAVLEVLAIVHMERSVAHMAAIESQANKAQQYVKKFFGRPFLREYVTLKNERRIEVKRYVRNLGDGRREYLTLPEWEALPEIVRDDYEEIHNYIQIVICTVAGANSEHVPFFVVDEVDVVPNPDAYEESKFIPAQMGNKLPITLYTSTRKYSTKLVQKEIDNAPESGLQIRHWNILDVTRACQPERYRPDLPMVPVYRSDDTLKAIHERDWLGLGNDEQNKYVKDTAHAGCMTNCRLFAICRGRLITQQHSRSILLKKIDHVIGLFKKVSIAKAKAQLLCWKPEGEDLIYPYLSRETHCLSAAQIAEKITGEPVPNPKEFKKIDLIALAKERQMRFAAGMDWGYSHNFAVVTGIRDGNRMFIIDVIAQPHLELGQKLQVAEYLKDWGTYFYPDTESPSEIKSFEKAGFQMRKWKKVKDSVVGGIEIVRLKLSPAVGEPQVFFLRDDPSVDYLVMRLSHYAWTMDAAGKVTNVPDDEDDDECDATRYLLMNEFAPRGKVSAPQTEHKPAKPAEAQQQYTRENWMQKQIAELVGVPFNPSQPQTLAEAPKTKGRRGKFCWSI